MSFKFVPLKVAEIIRETPDANTVVFEKPADGSFNYLPGQYLTLKFDIDGESVRRAYSLCSSPISEERLAVTVKRVDGGKVSNYIADHVNGGQTVEVMPPMGNFKVDLNENKFHHYVLVGGGSGITPLMSILKSVLEVEQNAKVTLVYGNRDLQSIIFREQLVQLQKQYDGRLRVIHALDNPTEDWTGISGQLNRQVLLGLLNDINGVDQLPKSFWLCGPTGLMEEAEAALGFLGVPKDNIKREVFTSKLPDTTEKDLPKTIAGEGKPGDYTIKVSLDGETKDVMVKKNVTILEAVINEGMDPPFACQMGVCCTCRAQVTSGLVQMEEDEGLSDTEIEEGFVLTCQSHPMSEGVELEFK